ncbi:MAG: superfamily protein [Verrucomicrobiales bacterium]|nr:superfamily protein [Verrucomicrobiales bacterium]
MPPSDSTLPATLGSRLDRLLEKAVVRFLVNSLMVWAMMALYMYMNHHQPAVVERVAMPEWVPFLPGFVVPYIFLLGVTWGLPVAIRTPAMFRACLLANACGWLLVMPWWWLTPTMMGRPPLPAEPWTRTFILLWASDRPCNIFPCGHGVGPVVAAWFASRDRPAWRWPLLLFLILTLPSIALVWQHRPFDILVGLLAAGVGIAVASGFPAKISILKPAREVRRYPDP